MISYEVFKKIIKHYQDVKKKGIREFLRKFKNLTLLVLNFLLIFFFAIPIFVLVIIISPFFLIRFGISRSSIVGHFIANTELYLCKKKLKTEYQKLYYDFISFDENHISNLYLKKHYKSKISIYPNFIIKPFCNILDFLNKKNKFTKKFKIKEFDAGGDRDLDGLLYKTKCSINFKNKDEAELEKQLNKFDLDFSSKFICLNVRDEAYLKKTFPLGNWDYHNYRNWDIKNFIKASESLANRGYKVIRMGKVVNDKMNSKNSMIIDYANSEYRSDLLDVYLHTKCFLNVTTGTGIDLGSYVSRRPMAWIVVPIGTFYTFKNHFFATKHHRFLNTKKNLTLSEIFETGFGDRGPDSKTNNSIEMLQLNEDEINEYVLEVLDILEGKYIWSKSDKDLQIEFWNKYKFLVNKYRMSYFHKNYEAIFSPVQLRKNTQLLK